MTTQTIRLDLYDYGSSPGTVTIRNATTLALVDTADSVNKNSQWSSRYDAVFDRETAMPAGVYPIGVSFNGIPFLMYVTLTGVDGEIALARAEKAVELDSSVALQIDAIEEDSAAAVGYLTALTSALSALATKFTGITLVARWLGALAGKTADTTTRAEINATTAGASYNETTDSLEAQKDSGGLASSAYEAVVVASMPVGVTVGWPKELIVGDAYRTTTLTAPKLFIRDIDENVLAGLGTKGFADNDFIGTLRLAPLTDSTKELSLPPATIEVTTDDSPGIVFNDATAEAEYFELQIPHDKTALGVIKTRYTAQFVMNWGETREFERTVELGEIKFVRKATAAA